MAFLIASTTCWLFMTQYKLIVGIFKNLSHNNTDQQNGESTMHTYELNSSLKTKIVPYHRFSRLKVILL